MKRWAVVVATTLKHPNHFFHKILLQGRPSLGVFWKKIKEDLSLLLLIKNFCLGLNDGN